MLSAERRALIVSLCRDGFSDSEIASRLHLSSTTIGSIRHEAGVSQFQGTRHSLRRISNAAVSRAAAGSPPDPAVALYRAERAKRRTA